MKVLGIGHSQLDTKGQEQNTLSYFPAHSSTEKAEGQVQKNQDHSQEHTQKRQMQKRSDSMSE